MKIPVIPSVRKEETTGRHKALAETKKQRIIRYVFIHAKYCPVKSKGKSGNRSILLKWFVDSTYRAGAITEKGANKERKKHSGRSTP
ncbi:MAG: hypothetical protein ACRC9Q_05260 [Bacteroidales bacterium]